MPDHYQDASTLFKALAHPVRLQILDMLRQGEICVCHMEAALDKRQAYVSQQLMILRDANLIDSRRDGRKFFYRITDDAICSLLEVVLGPAKSDPDTLDNCPCPRCVVEFQPDIHA